MATSRSLLHKTKLNEFVSFCKDLGWIQKEPKGEFEVLRMDHKDYKHPLLVYKSFKETDHYTVHGVSLKLAQRFIKNVNKEQMPISLRDNNENF